MGCESNTAEQVGYCLTMGLQGPVGDKSGLINTGVFVDLAEEPTRKGKQEMKTSSANVVSRLSNFGM